MKATFTNVLLIVFLFVTGGCVHTGSEREMKTNNNPGVYFEIPVSDMKRAMAFYSFVFGYDFTFENIHGNEMAFLPFKDGERGIAGALVKGEIYQPTRNGVLIYLHTPDIQQTLQLAEQHGGQVNMGLLQKLKTQRAIESDFLR
jgi:uncharacterized protein